MGTTMNQQPAQGSLSLHLARDPRYSRDSGMASRRITDISADSQD